MKIPLLSCLVLPLAGAMLHAETPAKVKETASPAPPAASSTGGVQYLDAVQAAKALAEAAKPPAKPIIVIDVRTPEEFAAGHIKGARNIDIASPEFEQNLAKLDPANTYLVECAAGGRSTRSLRTFGKLGFKSILHLDGGFNGWKKAGLPVEKPAAPAAPVK